MNNQSSSEFLSPPQNNFEQIVKSVGITLNTPPRYLYDNFSFKEETTKDELTGLPIESDVVRKKIAGRLGQATRDNQGWVCIYADADNLKTANTKFGRDFGDLVIKYGAAVILETIDRIGLNKNTE
jgi:GGDEF domain-containing protein